MPYHWRQATNLSCFAVKVKHGYCLPEASIRCSNISVYYHQCVCFSRSIGKVTPNRLFSSWFFLFVGSKYPKLFDSILETKALAMIGYKLWSAKLYKHTTCYQCCCFSRRVNTHWSGLCECKEGFLREKIVIESGYTAPIRKYHLSNRWTGSLAMGAGTVLY